MLAFKPHGESVFQVAFSPDGSSIATSGRRPPVCVSDAATGRVRWRFTHSSPRHIVLGLAYSPDGTQLAAVGWQAVTILNAETGETLHTHPGCGYAVTYTPDGTAVVTGKTMHTNGATRTDVRTGRAEDVTGLEQLVLFNRLRYSPDGRLLAALSGSRVIVLDARTSKQVGLNLLSNSNAGVGGLAFHPTAPLLVYSDGPKLLAFHPETTGAPTVERKRSTKHIQDAAFTPDGKHLITVSNDTMAVLWETTGWTEVRTFAWDIGALKAVAVAPDGGRAICASDRGRAVVWDLDL